jgi:hypothetical protein
VSQFILDEQLLFDRVLLPIRKWASVKRIDELRPDEVIKDERIPVFLRQIKNSTFVTIDTGFWNARFCHPQYCILFFALRDNQQEQLPLKLRKLCTLKEFGTKRARMGKVAKISANRIEWWERGESSIRQLLVDLR